MRFMSLLLVAFALASLSAAANQSSPAATEWAGASSRAAYSVDLPYRDYHVDGRWEIDLWRELQRQYPRFGRDNARIRRVDVIGYSPDGSGKLELSSDSWESGERSFGRQPTSIQLPTRCCGAPLLLHGGGDFYLKTIRVHLDASS